MKEGGWLKAGEGTERILPYGTCPFCGIESKRRCRCRRGDMWCPSGHAWHHNGSEIHAGSSDHASAKCCNGEAIARVLRSQ